MTDATEEAVPESAAVRLSDVLLGAMYSDRHAAPEEHEVLRRILCQLLGREQLPLRVEARLQDFDPAEFDLERKAYACCVIQKIYLPPLVQL